MVFNATYNISELIIMAVIFLVEEIGVHGENHWPASRATGQNAPYQHAPTFYQNTPLFSKINHYKKNIF